MPLQRAKLHSKTGKVRIINQQPKQNSGQRNNNANRSEPPPSTSTEAPSQASAEAEQQFMIELYWCVQQLENSLNSGKLNQRQAQDAEKSLKTLKSANQSIIKKRQIMRTTFGDYRSKMAEEERKYSIGSKQIKFTNSGLNTKGKKSYFVKKSLLSTCGKDFKFNFPINEIEQLNISNEQEQRINNGCQGVDAFRNEKSQENNDSEASNNTTTDETNNSNNSTSIFNFKYVPSENTFRFNFNIIAEHP